MIGGLTMRNYLLTLSIAALLVVSAPVASVLASSSAPSLAEVSVVSAGAEDGGRDNGGETTTISAKDEVQMLLDEGKVIKLPREATSVFVANPQVANVQVKSGTLIYVYAVGVGKTSFHAVDKNDNVIVSKTVVVGFDLGALRQTIRKITGGDSVKVSQVDDMILLTGSVENPTVGQDVVRAATRYLPDTVAASGNGAEYLDAARQFVINRLEYTGSNQVNLRVRVAEVRREAIKVLGISANASNPRLFGDVDFSLGFEGQTPSGLSGSAGSAGLGTTWGATDLSLALDALVSDGLATILAEPNLTAMSGETASFLAGGEFPQPYLSDSDTVTVEYREYGVRLSFTPTVVNGSRINLRVAPEVSERDDSNTVTFYGGEFPGLVTRKAETSVELGSGQSFAIAGLLQNATAQNVDKFPGLGDLPVVGQLFRSESFRQNQSELVIIVTPYLVKPTSASQIAVPTDGFVPPNDVDRYLNGRFNSEVPTPEAVKTARPTTSPADGGLSGNVGYVLQ